MLIFFIITDLILRGIDPQTPIEETARALDGIVKSGKALYVGISNYDRGQENNQKLLKFLKNCEHNLLLINENVLYLKER